MIVSKQRQGIWGFILVSAQPCENVAYSVFLSSRKRESGTYYLPVPDPVVRKQDASTLIVALYRSLVPGGSLIYDIPSLLAPASFSHAGERSTTSANETIASCFRRPPELPNTTSGLFLGAHPAPHRENCLCPPLRRPPRPSSTPCQTGKLICLAFFSICYLGVLRCGSCAPPYPIRKSQVALFYEHLPYTFKALLCYPNLKYGTRCGVTIPFIRAESKIWIQLITCLAAFRPLCYNTTLVIRLCSY